MSIIGNSNADVNRWPPLKPRRIDRVDVDSIEARVRRIARRDASITELDPKLKLDGLAGVAIDQACAQILEIEHPPLAAYQFNLLYWAYIAAFADARRQAVVR
jgi:hypothetical protein